MRDQGARRELSELSDRRGTQKLRESTRSSKEKRVAGEMHWFKELSK